MSDDNPKGYENPDLLWSPAQLQERLSDPNLRIIDTRPGERFAMGHIPGARHFNVYGINCDDSDEAPLQSFLRMWAFLLGNRGVSFENTIVFYDDRVGNTCVRGFWFLELFGHRDVHVLDGGYGAWERSGLPTTRDAEPPQAAKFEFTLQREKLATYKDVLAAIDDENHVLLDTRTEGEWTGTTKRAKRGGALPGAVWQEWLEHLTPEGEMKSAEELRSQFEAIGVTPEKEVTAY
ncbi:sulfurtransferase [Nitrospinota bacterium]